MSAKLQTKCIYATNHEILPSPSRSPEIGEVSYQKPVPADDIGPHGLGQLSVFSYCVSMLHSDHHVSFYIPKELQRLGDIVIYG